MKFLSRFVPFYLLILLASCNGTGSGDGNGNETPAAKPVPSLSWAIAAIHPHDTSYFTEGLEFYKGTLIESTGLKEQSRLVQMEFPSGKVLQQVTLDPQYFGEGVTVLNDTVYQLTYQEHKVLVYTAKDFKKVKEFPLNGEGWGLTNDGKHLIASNGSSDLFFYDPATFRLLRVQSVTESEVPVVNINELEYIEGFIYANQWQYNYILKIDPSNGQVVAKMDLTDMVNRIRAKEPKAEVLNGIAYNQQTRKVYVTGKNWPELYEIRIQ